MNYTWKDTKTRDKAITIITVAVLVIPLFAWIIRSWPSIETAIAMKRSATERNVHNEQSRKPLSTPLILISAEQYGERVDWLKEHAIPIRTLEADDTNFSDLAPISNYIENARVVQLGEPTHGDGAGFEAKVRLIKFLHKEMGFDIMSWESNLYECMLSDAALRTDIPVNEAAAKGIYSIWTNAAEVQPLFEYIRKSKTTSHPLDMVGFDCQSIGTVLEHIFQFLDKAYPGSLSQDDRKTLEELHELVSYGKFSEKSESERSEYVKVLDKYITLAEQTSSHVSERERKLMLRNLQNFWDFQHAYSVPMEDIRNGGEKGSRRDLSMGKNLEWLAKEFYPDRKIITWAANMHLAESMTAIDGFGNFKGRLQSLKPMGQVASELLGDDLYTIGITAYHGTSGRVNRDRSYPVGPMPTGSFEELCHQTGHKYLFVDLKSLPEDHWMRTGMTAGPIGYGPMKGDWAKVFDALLFIDEMHAATPLETSK